MAYERNLAPIIEAVLRDQKLRTVWDTEQINEAVVRRAVAEAEDRVWKEAAPAIQAFENLENEIANRKAPGRPRVPRGRQGSQRLRRVRGRVAGRRCCRRLSRMDDDRVTFGSGLSEVEYEARDFLLHLFASLCRKVLGGPGRDRADPLVHWRAFRVRRPGSHRVPPADGRGFRTWRDRAVGSLCGARRNLPGVL